MRHKKKTNVNLRAKGDFEEAGGIGKAASGTRV